MSARSAFEAAKRRIEKARASGATKLDLSRLRDLKELPEEIGGLKGLTALKLNRTRVSDITALGGLTALTSLDLGDTQVSDIAALAEMTALTTLNLMGTKVSDIAPLEGMTALVVLDLCGTLVSDIAALRGLLALSVLDLRVTHVSNIAALPELKALAWLDLDGSAVLDLRPLRSLSQLSAKPFTFKSLGNTRGGLTFNGCAAAKADPRIAEIAEIPDPATRARELFAYLEDWVPPGQDRYDPGPGGHAPHFLARQPRHTTADQIALLLRFSAGTRLSASTLAGQIALLLRDAPNEPGTNHIRTDLQIFVDLQDALTGIAEVAATKGNSETAELARMADKVAAYEAAIERLVSKLDAALAENANLKTELAETLERAETAEGANGRPIFWPKYKETLSSGLAELTVWAGKCGLIAGSVHFLGNTPTVIRLVDILEKLL